MKFIAGTILCVTYFPNQEDKTKFTPRFVFVVEDLVDEIEIIPITKQINQQQNYINTILILKESTEGKQMMLEYDSLFILDRITILKKNSIKPIYQKGKCSDEFLDIILEKLSK